MKQQPAAPSYKRQRFPPEIISYSVWLYFRFARSYRDVEELLAERGVIVTYETVRQWCRKFGQQYANALRRRRPQPGDKWLLDDATLKISVSRRPGEGVVGRLRRVRGWQHLQLDAELAQPSQQPVGERGGLLAVQIIRAESR